MEYFPSMPLHYKHFARHTRLIPGTPVIFRDVVDLLSVNTVCDFERGGAKKLIIAEITVK